jgi:NodT family efflux transporter outer membrane factor (OMF) lipoprotein
MTSEPSFTVPTFTASGTPVRGSCRGKAVRAATLLLRAVPILMVSACTVGPDFHRPAALSVPAATDTAFTAPGLVAHPVAADWWEAFGDPVLARIEILAVAGNLDLQAATARVARGRAALRIAGAAGLPTAGAATSYMRERASPNGILGLTGASAPGSNSAGGSDPFGTTTLDGASGSSDYDLFQVGFDASWELDLWGKARRTREAARASAQAAVYERDAARVSLTAEVARTYLVLRGAQARLSVVQSNRETVARGHAIAQSRELHGAASRYDAATAGTQLATIDATIPAIEREADAARNALALLTGAEPHALDALLNAAVATIPRVEGPVTVGLATELVRNRPDIAAAEADLHAATARIGVAKADFYPSLSLTGSLGTQALDISNVPQWASRQFIVGPVLNLPIFQGGRLKGQLQLTRADEQAAAIHYRATVLRAWHEVDDALSLVRTERARAAAAEQAVVQSRIAVQVAHRRYGAGATGYIDVLIAERAQLASEAEQTVANTDSAVAVITLYKSVGGGWTPLGQTAQPGHPL